MLSGPAPPPSLVGRSLLGPSRLLSLALVERLAPLLVLLAALSRAPSSARRLSEGLSLLACLSLGAAPTGRLLSRDLSVDVLLASPLLLSTGWLGAALDRLLAGLLVLESGGSPASLPRVPLALRPRRLPVSRLLSGLLLTGRLLGRRLLSHRLLTVWPLVRRLAVRPLSLSLSLARLGRLLSRLALPLVVRPSLALSLVPGLAVRRPGPVRFLSLRGRRGFVVLVTGHGVSVGRYSRHSRPTCGWFTTSLDKPWLLVARYIIDRVIAHRTPVVGVLRRDGVVEIGAVPSAPVATVSDSR